MNICKVESLGMRLIFSLSIKFCLSKCQDTTYSCKCIISNWNSKSHVELGVECGCKWQRVQRSYAGIIVHAWIYVWGERLGTRLGEYLQFHSLLHPYLSYQSWWSLWGWRYGIQNVYTPDLPNEACKESQLPFQSNIPHKKQCNYAQD